MLLWTLPSGGVRFIWGIGNSSSIHFFRIRGLFRISDTPPSTRMLSRALPAL